MLNNEQNAPLAFGKNWGKKVKLPRELSELTWHIAKTICTENNGAFIAESAFNEADDLFSISNIFFATDKHIAHAPRIALNMVAFVIPLYGSADCNIVQLGRRSLTPPGFYFARVLNDFNKCEFAPGVSAFFYVYLSPRLIQMLLGLLPDSTTLHRLLQACEANRPELIDYPHQVTDAYMTELLLNILHIPFSKRQEVFPKVMQLITAAVSCADNPNTPAPIPGKALVARYSKAEQVFLENAQRGKSSLLSKAFFAMKALAMQRLSLHKMQTHTGSV